MKYKSVSSPNFHLFNQMDIYMIHKSSLKDTSSNVLWKENWPFKCLVYIGFMGDLKS